LERAERSRVDWGVYSKSRAHGERAQPKPDKRAGTILVGLFAPLDCAPEHRLLQGSRHRPDHENRGSDASSVLDVDAAGGEPNGARVRITDDLALHHGDLSARVRDSDAHTHARDPHGWGNLRVFGHEDAVCERDEHAHSVRSADVHALAESHSDVYSHSDVDALSNRDGHLHGESDPDFHSDPDRHGDADCHRTASFHPNADHHEYRDADGYTPAHGYRDAHGYTPAHGYRDTHGDSN
jgi:hypothetical protein